MSTPKKKLYLFSTVKDVHLFKSTGFYVTDENILTDLGYEIVCTNRMSDFLRFRSYDAALIYFYRKGAFPAMIARFLGKPVFFTGGVDTVEDVVSGSAFKSRIEKVLFRICYFFSTYCNIVSDSDYKNVSQLVRNPSKLIYFPHCIRFDDFAHHDAHREKIITTIVWMEAKVNVIRKGVDKAIHVFAELLKLSADYRFVIAGAIGEGTTYLQELVQQLEVDQAKIVFTGSIPEGEKIALLKKSRYYLQLSNFEGFGIAAIEALAAGDCVVHSGKGGLKSNIGDYGIQVIEPNNYGAVAKVIFENDRKGIDQERINKGIEHVRKNFSYQRRLDEFEKMLINANLQ